MKVNQQVQAGRCNTFPLVIDIAFKDFQLVMYKFRALQKAYLEQEFQMSRLDNSRCMELKQDISA
jgi:hypothetical protein